MATGANMLPIGLGGDAGLLWLGGGGLPPAFSGSYSLPLGFGRRGVGAEASSDSLLGATIRGRARLGPDAGWWEASCSETAHSDDEQLPETIELSVGGQRFLITADAVSEMADATTLCEADESKLPLASIAAALEKLAARLPTKSPKHHTGLIVDDWVIGVDTTESPWRVTDARLQSEE